MNWKHGLLAAAGAGAGLAAWSLTRSKDTAGDDLTGKVVLITGGSRGLGLQLAREFGKFGARVVIAARDEAELERARTDLAERGIRVQTIQVDLTDPSQIRRMADDAAMQNGAVDILINNAGLIQTGPFEDMVEQDFVDAMALMFWAPLHATMAVLPEMKRRGRGKIVNITSIGGKVSVPHLLPYCCAKFALTALSEGLRSELAPQGIQVVTIVPGLMRTGSHLQAKFKGQHAREYQWFSLGAATPLTSISVERAAREIRRATQRGDAEKILSIPADLAARFHGLFPELTAPLLELVNRHLLPAPTGIKTTAKSGNQVKQEMGSRLFDLVTALGNRAAIEMNELVV